MFILEKDFEFCAAHRLEHHDGKCRELHGHNFKMTVAVVGQSLHVDGPKRGMVMDYATLKGIVSLLVDRYLDHHFLNETLATDSPTSEVIAEWLWRQLAPEFSAMDCGVFLHEIVIEETCTARCRYKGPQLTSPQTRLALFV
jgi:6-pyruvoyltetrahydropterin/6-carboxytetrahydropterin synthase